MVKISQTPSHIPKILLRMQQKVKNLAVNIDKACRQQMLYDVEMPVLSSKMETSWTFNILKEQKQDVINIKTDY